MKPFSLEEYLANPSKKVVTKSGKNARIICTDRKSKVYPVVALIENELGEEEDVPRSYTKKGTFFINCQIDDDDLFFAPEKHEGWVNIFKGTDGNSYIGHHSRIFESKEDAEKAGIGCSGYITVKVEWEE